MMSRTIRTIVVKRDVYESLRIDAGEQRKRWSEQGTLAVNVLSSPGAGKTTLLQATARRLASRYRMAVLVGDLETDRDAQRLAPLLPAVQLTTGGACHLDIALVRRGVEALGNIPLDFLFIENVGNLVCPASHDLGEHLRVVLLSTTEGDDKPAKYPKIFRTSQALVITKTDLIPFVPFDVAAAEREARKIQPELACFQICALRDEGVGEWCKYLEEQRNRILSMK
ncbi:MAG: hydrogenase accessory protein HypB [Pirellulaceae bacterium]|nr:MAG: hydrogenase accessory protein HypB [Pirellulaceae bacterium]